MELGSGFLTTIVPELLEILDMARNAPAFQFYVDDFLGGTTHMSNEEVGLYIRLLCMQWSHGIVTDRHVRAFHAGADVVAFILSEKFTKVDGGYRNRRLEEVRELSRMRKQAASKGGSKTAATRVAKSQQTDQQSRQQTGVAKLNPPSPTPSPTPSSSSDSVSNSVSSVFGPGGQREIKPRHVAEAPPSVAEVRQCMADAGLPDDAERFVAFYSANGWKQGRGKPIVDWRAAARLWRSDSAGASPPVTFAQQREANTLAAVSEFVSDGGSDGRE